MTDGIGCVCFAKCEAECSCDADWTPQEIYDLRKEIENLKSTNKLLFTRSLAFMKAQEEYERLKKEENIIREKINESYKHLLDAKEEFKKIVTKQQFEMIWDKEFPDNNKNNNLYYVIEYYDNVEQLHAAFNTLEEAEKFKEERELRNKQLNGKYTYSIKTNKTLINLDDKNFIDKCEDILFDMNNPCELPQAKA